MVTNTRIRIHSLPDNEMLDWTKLKAFADGKSNVAKLMNFLLDRVENIVGKGENAGYKHFLLFQQCFQKTSSSGSIKVEIVWKMVNLPQNSHGKGLKPK